MVHVVASDYEDASRRLRAIGTTGQVDGELVSEIEASPKIISVTMLEMVIWMLWGALALTVVKQFV